MIPQYSGLFIRYRDDGVEVPSGRRPVFPPNERPCEVAPRSPLAKLCFSQQQNLRLHFRTFFIFLLLTRGGKLRANLLLFTDVLTFACTAN